MTRTDKYWDLILRQYKESVLSMPAFCKQIGVTYSQFQYRWYKQSKAQRSDAIHQTKQTASPIFESIAITDSAVNTRPSGVTRELVICLPNQIRCEIRSGLTASELATLLKELVTLC